MIEILKYTDRVGRAPFDRWFLRLRDPAAQAAILIRLSSLTLGLAGDTRVVGSGVFELRVHIGPGYRVYFAWERRGHALLLGGGTKSSQVADIESAKRCLAAHREKDEH